MSAPSWNLLRWASVLIVAGALSLVVVLSQVLGSVEFEHRVEQGVNPRLAPDQVRSIVNARLEAMASDANRSLQSASALAVAVELGRAQTVYPDVPDLSRAGWGLHSVVWIVTAHAPFVSNRGRSTEPQIADSGFLVIDDTSGEIVAMGFLLSD